MPFRRFLPFSHRQKKLAPFRFRLSAKTAFCAFLLPLQIKPTLLGFDLISGGYDTSAPQKPKITRKSIAVRCRAVLPEQKSGQTTKRPQGILCVFLRSLRMYGRFSARQNRVCPCPLMVIKRNKSNICTRFRKACADIYYKPVLSMEKGFEIHQAHMYNNSRIMSVKFREKGRPFSHSHSENVIPFNCGVRS